MAHVIKGDLRAELFSYSIDEDKRRYLELLDGKLLLVTNTVEVVQRYKSLTDKRFNESFSVSLACSMPLRRANGLRKDFSVSAYRALL